MAKYSIDLETKIKIGVLAVIIGFVGLKGCAAVNGNMEILDTKKSFNIALDDNEDAVSITNISSYTDYSGTQAQFVTQDGLIVLTSTIDTQLLNQFDYSLVREYATCLANGDSSIVYSYDELQGLNPNMDESLWNKTLIDLQYTYNYALIKSEEGIIIAEIDEWKTYEEDDKIQIVLTNGTTILKDIADIKLLNDYNASENSVYNYALSLVGDESKIKYHSTQKQLKR